MKGLAIALAGCLFLAAMAAEAQEDPKEEAKKAFAEGRALFEEGKHAEAAAEFRRAYRLAPNWKVLYNIGQCEALAKQHGLALESFETYLADGGDDVPEARRGEVLAEVERLRKMVGSIEVKAPDGAVVIVDGLERGRAPLPGPMMVAAGKSRLLMVKLGGKVLLERQIKVSGGQTITVEAKAAAAGDAAPADQGEDEPDGQASQEPGDDPDELTEQEGERDGKAVAGWVTLGVGGALLIGGAVTGSMALKLNKDLEEECPGGNCPEDQWDNNDKMKALGVTTDVLIGVGAAAAATGIVLLIVSATGDESDGSGEVALVPAVGSGYAGACIQGRF